MVWVLFSGDFEIVVFMLKSPHFLNKKSRTSQDWSTRLSSQDWFYLHSSIQARDGSLWLNQVVTNFKAWSITFYQFKHSMSASLLLSFFNQFQTFLNWQPIWFRNDHYVMQYVYVSKIFSLNTNTHLFLKIIIWIYIHNFVSSHYHIHSSFHTLLGFNK